MSKEKIQKKTNYTGDKTKLKTAKIKSLKSNLHARQIQKKLLSVICTLLIILSAIIITPITGSAADTRQGSNGKIRWVLTSGTLTISRYSTSGKVSIPDYSTSNYAPWHKYASDIKKVVVNDNILEIGDYAFYGLSKVKTITLGKVVATIGTASFGHCDALTSFDVDSENVFLISVKGILYNRSKTALIAYPANKTGNSFDIPSTVTTIRGYAFNYNRNLITITQNTGSVKTINGHAFSNCSSLKNVTIRNNCVTLGNKAFYNSQSLTKVVIPPSVTEIPDDLFSPTQTLENLKIYCAKNSPIYTYAKKNNYIIQLQDWTFTCNFNADGGTCDTASITVTYNDCYGELPSAKKDGYQFKGWYLNNTKITSATIMSTASSHTLKAKYEPNYYTVYFDANGGDCDTLNKTVLFAGNYGELPVPEKEGYVFLGWYLDDEQITASTFVNTPASHTLKAKYSENENVIQLEPNGGYCDTQTITVKYGLPFGSLPLPTKSDYTFTGWYTKDGTQIFTDTIYVNESIKTLYAHYKKIPSKSIRQVTGISLKYLSKTSVKLSWDKQKYADGYEIYKKSNSGKYSLCKKVKASSAKLKLSKKKSYKFKVRAYINDGNTTNYSAYSSSVSRAKTYVAKPKITNNYSGLTGILKVKWKSIRNANKYEIYQYKNSKWKKVRTTTSLSFFLYADKGKTYKFKIRAYTTVMKHKIYSKFAQITRKI